MGCSSGGRGLRLVPGVAAGAALALAGAPAFADNLGGIAILLYGPVWFVLAALAVALSSIAVGSLARTRRLARDGQLDRAAARSRLRRSTILLVAAVVATCLAAFVFVAMLHIAAGGIGARQALVTVAVNGPVVGVTVWALLDSRKHRAALPGLDGLPAKRQVASDDSSDRV